MAKQQQRRPTSPAPSAKKSAPAQPSRRSEPKRSWSTGAGDNELIFGRKNFMIMGIGLLLIIIGLVTMSGGHMPDPNTWDPGIIYSFRRITLAPMLMLAGFAVIIYGIFNNSQEQSAAEQDNSIEA